MGGGRPLPKASLSIHQHLMNSERVFDLIEIRLFILHFVFFKNLHIANATIVNHEAKANIYFSIENLFN
jgi:hypothetical protein